MELSCSNELSPGLLFRLIEDDLLSEMELSWSNELEPVFLFRLIEEDLLSEMELSSSTEPESEGSCLSDLSKVKKRICAVCTHKCALRLTCVI